MGYSLKILGLVALQQGDVETAGSLLKESLALFKELGDQENIPQSLVVLARVSFVQGDYATARALFEESLALFKVVDNKWYMAACLIELGLLATVQGEAVWAARLVGAAEALCQAINGVLAPSIRAMQELTCATVHAQVGEEVFKATWAEGYTMAPEQALAAQGPATMATTAPAGSSSVPQAPNASTHPDGLTAREVEVLRLVAQGLTDAQVAEQLILSRYTISWYVSAIYRKLGVSSRSAATHYAMKHHLI